MLIKHGLITIQNDRGTEVVISFKRKIVSKNHSNFHTFFFCLNNRVLQISHWSLKKKKLYPPLIKLSQDDKQIANVVVPFGGGEEVSFLLEEENGYPHQIDKSKLTSPNINVCLDLCSHTSNFRSSQIIQGGFFLVGYIRTRVNDYLNTP